MKLLLLALIPVSLTLHPQTVLIKNVTVIDVRDGQLKKNTDVLIEQNKIKAIEKGMKPGPGATVIDASNKYLIPGLWDMHIHALTDKRYEWVFPLLIANGITGIREMGNNLTPEQINQIRQSILDKKLLGPRMGATTAQIFDAPGTTVNVSVQIDSVDLARRLVRQYKQQGMDFIKVYNLLSRDVYLAIVDEAKKQNIPFAGHVPFSMTLTEVSDLGQISVEHNTDVPMSCSNEEARFRQEMRQLAKSLPITARQPVDLKVLTTFDEQKAKTLFKHLAGNGTWMCPTSVVFLAGTKEEQERLNDERLKYIPGSIQ